MSCNFTHIHCIKAYLEFTPILVILSFCEHTLRQINLYSKKGSSIIQISNTGWASTAYFLFKRYQESSHSSLDLLQFGGFTLVTACLWMCLFPGTESVFYESIAKLESQHCLLKEKLEDLRISLTSAKDFRDGPLKNRGLSQL